MGALLWSIMDRLRWFLGWLHPEEAGVADFPVASVANSTAFNTTVVDAGTINVTNWTNATLGAAVHPAHISAAWSSVFQSVIRLSTARMFVWMFLSWFLE